MEKVSIIIPTYNCKYYIVKCIESVLKQTYKNLEIIIVDDGSTDGTKKLIKERYSNNEKIKYYYINNSGVSIARNFGIKNSTGEKLFFLDADDWLEEKSLENFVNKMIDSDADIVFSSGYFIDYTGTSRLKRGVKINEKKYLISQIISQKIPSYCWGKLYKKSIIDCFSINFNSHLLMMEDVVFNIEYIQNSEKISFLKNSGYHYFQRTDSTVKTVNFNKIESQFDALNIVQKNFLEKGCYNIYKKDLMNWYLNNKISFFYLNNNLMNKWEEYKNYNSFDILKSNLSMVNKFLFIMMDMGFYKLVENFFVFRKKIKNFLFS